MKYIDLQLEPTIEYFSRPHPILFSKLENYGIIDDITKKYKNEQQQITEAIGGAFHAFNIYRQIAFMRHVIPSFILGFLIVAIVQQIYITRGKL